MGCDIVYDLKAGIVTKNQNAYVQDILTQHKITHKHNYPCRDDIITGAKPKTKPLSKWRHSIYRSALQQAAYVDRPDIKFAVSVLQRYASNPVETDLEDLFHLYGYLNRFKTMSFKYSPSDLQLRGFVDASWEVNGHYGYLLSLGGENNACIVSKSARLRTVHRSSTEAEITAVNEVTSEVLWGIDMLDGLGHPQDPVCLKEDNEACISMMQRDPRNFQTKSKHVRIKWAFYRQQFKLKQLYLEHCRTTDMRADILTKPLTGAPFVKHIGGMFNCTATMLRGVQK